MANRAPKENIVLLVPTMEAATLKIAHRVIFVPKDQVHTNLKNVLLVIFANPNQLINTVVRKHRINHDNAVRGIFVQKAHPRKKVRLK